MHGLQFNIHGGEVLSQHFTQKSNGNGPSSSKTEKTNNLVAFLGFETVTEIAEELTEPGSTGIFYPLPEINANRFKLPTNLEPNMGVRTKDGKFYMFPLRKMVKMFDENKLKKYEKPKHAINNDDN